MRNKALRRKIDVYRAWYRLARSWSVLQFILFACVSVLSAYVLLDKLIYFSGVGYGVVALLIGVTGVAALLVFYLLHSAAPETVGYLIDRNAKLKNLVSSGLGAATAEDEVSVVVVGRAVDALSARTPRQLMSFSLNKAGRFLYVPAVFLSIVLVLPRVDLFGRAKMVEKRKAENAAVQDGALKLKAKLTSIENNTAMQSLEADKVLKDFNALATNMMGAAKDTALLNLGKFESKYNKEFSKERDFEKALKSMNEVPDMRGLAPERQKRLTDLIKDLKDADFGEAAKALRELAKDMQCKDLSAEEKKALAREMAKLAEKMQGGQMSEDMARLLREIESSEDMEDILRQCCEKAGDRMCEFAKFCDECDALQAMKDGLQSAKKAMLGDSFSDFDAQEVEKYMDAEAGKGRDGCVECAMLGLEGGEGSGDGTGGTGIGRGGLPLENMTDTAFKNEMSRSKINQGTILNQLFVSGIPEKGEAAAEYLDVVQAAKQQAASSLARDRIPREYENMVKTYFDSLDVNKKEEDEQAAP